MKSLFLLFSGLFLGLWTAWPGLVIPNNWTCFKDIIIRSSKEQISLKAALSVSPNHLLNRKNKTNFSKFRLVSDACFR